MQNINIEETFANLGLVTENFITIMHSDQGTYIRFDVESKEGVCYSIEVSYEDTGDWLILN